MTEEDKKQVRKIIYEELKFILRNTDFPDDWPDTYNNLERTVDDELEDME